MIRRLAGRIARWWIVVPFAGMAGILACAALSALSITCGALGAVSLAMAATCLLGLVEEPIRAEGGRDRD